MNPLAAIMVADKAADAGFKLYDKFSDEAAKHGWDLDGAVGDIANRLKDTALNTVDGVSDRIVNAPDVTEIIRAMKETPYEDGDFEEVYEDDLNDDGDPDVTAMDTSGDGEVDTVVTTSDSDKEEKDSKEEANDILTDSDKTSTGKSEKELTGNKELPKDYNSDDALNNISGIKSLKKLKDILDGSWANMRGALADRYNIDRYNI